ncbi:unnamed protein product [Strongylus vulgaris]|uniref:Uncharacterized protein n=1 Tax=Strongylus vulgaris TaxID=40348 RepID=A0A3P7L0D7_STRVU|nr:unnamed protein product [Strongylus vulgaris]
MAIQMARDDFLEVSLPLVTLLRKKRLLGVYLIANKELVYSHLEQEWGDAANIAEVREMIEKFKKNRGTLYWVVGSKSLEPLSRKLRNMMARYRYCQVFSEGGL